MMRDVVMMGRQEVQAKRDDNGTAMRNDDGTDDRNNAGSAMSGGDDHGGHPQPLPSPLHCSWKTLLAIRLVLVNAALLIARYSGRVSRWLTFAAARCVALASALLMPKNWRDWAVEAQAKRDDNGTTTRNDDRTDGRNNTGLATSGGGRSRWSPATAAAAVASFLETPSCHPPRSGRCRPVDREVRGMRLALVDICCSAVRRVGTGSPCARELGGLGSGGRGQQK